MSENNNAKKFAIGATLAAVSGYLAGILTAPKSGKETRSDIKNAANKSVAEAEKQLKRLHTQLSEVLEEAKKQAAELSGKARAEFDQLIEKTQAAKEKTRELLSNLHEDVAEDKDLQQAIKDADKAIEHLRTFLGKKA